MKKSRAVHKDLASAQPFPGKNHRVTHNAKPVPHIKHTKGRKGHSNSFVAASVATVPKGGGKRTRKHSGGK